MTGDDKYEQNIIPCVMIALTPPVRIDLSEFFVLATRIFIIYSKNLVIVYISK